MKKNIPLEVLEKLEPLLAEYDMHIRLVDDPGYAYQIFDADPKSTFYFFIQHQRSDGQHEVKYKPMNGAMMSEAAAIVSRGELPQFVENWLMLLEAYDKFVDSSYKKSIHQYQKEFFEDIKIIDPDPDNTFLNVDQQIALYDYIENIKELLPEYKQKASVEKVRELDSIAEDCEAFQENITILTKSQTIKALTKIWAKARRFGIPLLKKVLTEFGKEAIKALVKEGVEIGGNLMHSIPHTLLP
jgi:hypothetical protein